MDTGSDSGGDTQERWFARLVEKLGALDGVDAETRADGRVALDIRHDGNSAAIVLAGPAGGYAGQKDEYARLRETLAGLGIVEGARYVPEPPPAGRAPTPRMQAARAARRRAFDAWQDALQTLRRAEEALEVAYEIAQMRDYY